MELEGKYSVTKHKERYDFERLNGSCSLIPLDTLFGGRSFVDLVLTNQC